MTQKGLFNKDIMNMLLDSGCNLNDDSEDSEEDYIPLDDDGEIGILLSDKSSSDEENNRNKNMFELAPSPPCY